MWSPRDHLSCSDCPEPVITGLTQDATYTVTFSDRNGCTESATIYIEIIGRNVWLPNTFSPNGDNVNDYFYPVVTDGSYREVRRLALFDRWGNMVFQRESFPPNDPLSGWNGTFKNQVLNPGVFGYVMELEWIDGTTVRLYGDVTLTR